MSTEDPYATPDPNQVPKAPTYGQPPAGQQHGQPPAAPYGQVPPPPPAYAQTQPTYGQPPAGQQYGQQQYGQYGQQQYGQQYGQPTYGYGTQPPYTNDASAPQLQGLGDYASWGQRVGGYLLDGLITLPAFAVMITGFAIAFKDLSTVDNPDGTVSTVGTVNSGGMLIVFLGVLLAAALHIWNRWLKAGKTGQSIGRKAMGITMVDERTGQPIGALMAFVRDLAHSLDSWALMLGWLWPLWDDKRQTFADKVIKTTVRRVVK